MNNPENQKLKRSGRKYLVLTTFFVLLVIWVFLAPFLADFLIVEKPLERADAIWVLGGSSAYLERTGRAAVIYKQGIAPKVFIVNDGVSSGWNQLEQRNIPFYELSKRELIRQGVPAEAIEILPPLVGGTHEEAELFAAIARQQNLKSVLLVTSPHHSRRTLWTFQKSVLKNNLSTQIGLQASPIGEKAPSRWFWWMSGKGWSVVGAEYLKFAGYWLFY